MALFVAKEGIVQGRLVVWMFVELSQFDTMHKSGIRCFAPCIGYSVLALFQINGSICTLPSARIY